MTSSERPMPLTLKPWASIAYFILLIPAPAAGLGAYYAQWRIDAVDWLIPGFYSHASNLAISFFVLVSYGLLRLPSRATMVEMTIAGAVIVAANYGYEGLLTLFNTKDLADAHYGAIGVLLALALLFAIHRWGLRSKTSAR